MVLVDQWTSDGKGNNTQSFSSAVSGWTIVMKERHSRACLAQWQRMFLHGRSLTKNSPGLFFAVWLVPSKTMKFNHPRKFVPIQYATKVNACYHVMCRVFIDRHETPSKCSFTLVTRGTYVPMPRLGWMIAAHINYCWTHNTCSSIAKIHADALSNYWVSRQTEQQGSCLCNCIAHRKWQCKHCTNNCTWWSG